MYFQCRYLVQKFSKELKRVMIKMSDESVSIINSPWTVSTIPGSSIVSNKFYNQKNNNATLGLEFMRRLESRKKKKTFTLYLHLFPNTLYIALCCF